MGLLSRTVYKKYWFGDNFIIGAILYVKLHNTDMYQKMQKFIYCDHDIK